MNLLLRITRKSESWDYIYDNPNFNDYKNRTKNNMLDLLQLINTDTNDILFECQNVQTVSNHPLMKKSDTIRSGKFQVKCFVDQGGYHTEIHGIVNAYDISGQQINEYSMQYDNGQYIGRWLIHSSYYAPLKRDTKAYSGGCFIMTTENILKFNKILKDNGIEKGNIINGELFEI